MFSSARQSVSEFPILADRQLHLLHWSSWLTDSSISQFSCLTVLPPTKAEIFLLGVLSTICVWDYVVVGWKFELNILVVGPVNRISGTSVLSSASLDGFSVLFWTSIHPCHHHHQYQGKRILKSSSSVILVQSVCLAESSLSSYNQSHSKGRMCELGLCRGGSWVYRTTIQVAIVQSFSLKSCPH